MGLDRHLFDLSAEVDIACGLAPNIAGARYAPMRPRPDIQKQLDAHSKACVAGKKALKLYAAGKTREAQKYHKEAERYEAEYRAAGGKDRIVL